MLRVRPFRRNDAKAIVSFIENEDIFYKWSAGVLGSYPMTEKHFIEATSARDDNENYFPFVAFDETGVVGFFILRTVENGCALRFGFVLVDSKIRGKGYGTKMLKLGLEYAFHVYGVDKVTLGVFKDNLGAYYCYKKAGFVETGEESEYAILGTKWKCVEMECRK